MIICTRCGKDNQDQYKFCLGCGAKLEAARPAEAAKPAAEAPAAPTPAPAAAPKPAARASNVGIGSLGVSGAIVTPGPVLSGASQSAVRAPGMTPAVSGAGTPSPAAVARPSAAASVVVSASGGPAANAVAQRTPSPAAVAQPAPAASAGPAPARETISCPKCGKVAAAGFTFCGACGTRLKAAAGPAAAGAAAGGVQRTMFMAPTSARSAARGHLTLVRPDGTEGGMHPLHEGENLIGRGQGSLFDADPYLSPRHAEFVLNDQGLLVRDLRSLNGVFIRITQEEPLDSGDIFRIGQELLRFDVIAPPSPLEDGTEVIGTPNPGYWGRISVIVGRDVDGPAFPLFDESIVLGRERGDILFPEDGYVSGTHAQITLRDGRVYLSDLGSSNGSFFRIRSNRTVPAGSLLLMGQQLFRVAYR